jgi:hypothetical protein
MSRWSGADFITTLQRMIKLTPNDLNRALANGIHASSDKVWLRNTLTRLRLAMSC